MIKTVTIFDLETTGLDSTTSEVIEFGAILYSVEFGATLSQVSSLRNVDINEAANINKIEAEWTDKISKVSRLSTKLLEQFVEQSEYVVAHCKEFDMGWNFANTLSKPWLCTYNDFVWQENDKPTTLIQTALNHGVPVTSAHRALVDCQLIASLFNVFSERGELQSLFSKAVERANEEIVEVIALVSYSEKNKAKEKGFIWDSNSEKSNWIKKIRKSELLEEAKSWDFDWFEILT